MSTSRSRRSWRRAGQLLLVGVVIASTIGVLVLVAMNAVLLGTMTGDIALAQRRAANLSNSQREGLRLLVMVTRSSGRSGSDVDEFGMDVQRGLFVRQVQVSAASFPDDARRRTLADVSAQIERFPWNSLHRSGSAGRAAHAAAIQLVSDSERRVKELYSEQEQYFYTATIASLEAKRRSQTATAALVGLVVVLSTSGLVTFTRRTRSDVAHAYEALKGEMVERRALEAELTHQAQHDPLTGLPNRALLLKRLEDALTGVPAAEGCVSVILVDLDGFKNVNDTLGHSAGDELLQRAAERLRGCVSEADTAARLGGDEFAIVVTGRYAGSALAVGRRIVNTFGRPIVVGGQEITVTASVGVAHRDGGESAEDLLRDADIAMYVAKDTGKAHHEVFHHAMRTRAAQRTTLQQQLARAVEMGDIEVHYQPLVELGTMRPMAVEALARWRHPERSMIPPDVFIPIAEESGAILGIGRAVLRQACSTVQAWRRTVPGQEALEVAVNVSVHQVLSGQLVDHVTEALDASGLPAGALTLEITESAVLEKSERVADELAGLQRKGVKIAVDDFGSGYSSLGFLLRLDADILKIDRTLLDYDTTRSESLVQAVCELGRSLGLTVIAEGVETGEHLERARAALCHAVQGYYLSRPLPADAVPDVLTATLPGSTPATPPGPAPAVPSPAIKESPSAEESPWITGTGGRSGARAG